MEKIIDDDREIASVVYDKDASHNVGQFGVTKIEAYKEAGPGGWVPYIAVYGGSKIRHRIPAWMVQINYKT